MSSIDFSLASSLIYSILLLGPVNSVRTVSKTGSTALLSLHAFRTGAPFFLFAALALGSLGDYFLSFEGEDVFLKGLGSFLVAHLFYIGLFARSGAGVSKIFAEKWRMAATLGMVSLAPFMNTLLMPNVSETLQLPIMVYSGTILVMVLTVLTMEKTSIVVGGLAFALSDAILSADEFLVPKDSTHRAWMQYAVWILYYGGQFFIARGFTGSTV